jgi:chorismate mutase
MTENERAIRTAVQQQIAAETAIRRTFFSELARAKQATNPPAAKKPKPKPARELTDLEKMRRLARASGWKPARETQIERGVLDGWDRIGGAR